MRFKRSVQKFISCLVITFLVISLGKMVALAAEAWGFCYGGNPYDHKISYLKDYYVGDYGIFENLTDTGEQSIADGSNYIVGNDYAMQSSGMQIGYQSYKARNEGSDKDLYKLFANVNKAGGSTLKQTFDKGGKFYKQNKGFGKDGCYERLKPSNAEYYSPLNVLRMMQLYMVTRGGKSKGFIGGWPVQIDASYSPDNFKYNIEGARTIKTVYKEFTGKDYNKSKCLKEITDDNCTATSLCGKLYKGKITMKKASEEMKSILKNAGVLVYDGTDLLTAGCMTYEEYCVRSFRGDKAIRYSAANESATDVENTKLGLSTCYKTYLDSLPASQKLSVKKNQTFIVNVFRYLEEYGVRFNSVSDVDEDPSGNTKSIFKDSGDLTYFEINSSGGFTNYANDEDGIGQAVLSQLKTYYKNTSDSNYAMGSNCDKPLMNEIAEKIVKNMRDAVNADTDPDGLATLNQYITYDKTKPVGKAASADMDNAEDASLAKSINSKKKNTVSGLDTLNKITDAYVVNFFIGLATSSGNSDNTVVNNEYNKIINILYSEKGQKGALTVNQCFNLMYSLERIKDQGQVYWYTFYAKSNMQVSSVLKYCSANLKRVYKYFYHEKTGTDDSVIASGKSKEKNPKQMYSDWCEAYTAVSSMGAKAYKKANKDNSGSDATQAFIVKYKSWKKSLKTGKTKYVHGVQHQDGFVPYGLEHDKDGLGDTTADFFKNIENSIDGKGKITTYDKNSQKKVWQWGLDTDELNETIKEHWWLDITNGVITIVGLMMMIVGFTLSSLYIFDHISGGVYDVIRRVTFRRIEYSHEKKQRRKTFIKFLVLVVLSAFMYDGTLIRWAIFLLQTTYRMLTVK